MNTLERRANKIEKAIRSLPRKDPDHGGLNIFVYGVSPEQDRENDRRRESISQCKHCRDDKTLNILVQSVAGRGDFHHHPAPPEQGPENDDGFRPLTIHFADFEEK